MADTAYFNGVMVSWNHVAWWVTMFGPDGTMVASTERYFGFKALNHGDDTRERPPQYGANPGGAPLGLPAGKYSPAQPRITMFSQSADPAVRAPFESLMGQLKRAAPDGRSIGEVQMYWHVLINSPKFQMDYEWHGLHLTAQSRPWETDENALMTELGFTGTRYLANGTTLYDSSQGIF